VSLPEGTIKSILIGKLSSGPHNFVLRELLQAQPDLQQHIKSRDAIQRGEQQTKQAQIRPASSPQSDLQNATLSSGPSSPADHPQRAKVPSKNHRESSSLMERLCRDHCSRVQPPACADTAGKTRRIAPSLQCSQSLRCLRCRTCLRTCGNEKVKCARRCGCR
jgi:hypothetical protein